VIETFKIWFSAQEAIDFAVIGAAVYLPIFNGAAELFEASFR
jgi:hypothetical protein